MNTERGTHMTIKDRLEQKKYRRKMKNWIVNKSKDKGLNFPIKYIKDLVSKLDCTQSFIVNVTDNPVEFSTQVCNIYIFEDKKLVYDNGSVVLSDDELFCGYIILHNYTDNNTIKEIDTDSKDELEFISTLKNIIGGPQEIERRVFIASNFKVNKYHYVVAYKKDDDGRYPIFIYAPSRTYPNPDKDMYDISREGIMRALTRFNKLNPPNVIYKILNNIKMWNGIFNDVMIYDGDRGLFDRAFLFDVMVGKTMYPLYGESIGDIIKEHKKDRLTNVMVDTNCCEDDDYILPNELSAYVSLDNGMYTIRLYIPKTEGD